MKRFLEKPQLDPAFKVFQPLPTLAQDWIGGCRPGRVEAPGHLPGERPEILLPVESGFSEPGARLATP